VKRYAAQVAVPPDYADRIKMLRAKRDLTQMRLADLLGVSFPTVSRWESGQLRPSLDVWRHIAQAEQFGLSALAPTRASSPLIREIAPSLLSGTHPLPAAPDFTADPATVRLAVEAHRLEYGYLVNPAFATEISLIEPLPHQRRSLDRRARSDQHEAQEPAQGGVVIHDQNGSGHRPAPSFLAGGRGAPNEDTRRHACGIPSLRAPLPDTFHTNSQRLSRPTLSRPVLRSAASGCRSPRHSLAARGMHSGQ
jgi:transcriptional regulator with XRE-family HTH domain